MPAHTAGLTDSATDSRATAATISVKPAHTAGSQKLAQRAEHPLRPAHTAGSDVTAHRAHTHKPVKRYETPRTPLAAPLPNQGPEAKPTHCEVDEHQLVRLRSCHRSSPPFDAPASDSATMRFSFLLSFPGTHALPFSTLTNNLLCDRPPSITGIVRSNGLGPATIASYGYGRRAAYRRMHAGRPAAHD